MADKVEDAEKVQTEQVRKDTAENNKNDAKQREDVVQSVVGGAEGPEVTTQTPEEIEKNQAKVDTEYRKAEKAQTENGKAGTPGDNGKTYKDERIQPSDTNAPDAGLLPDGTRIAS